MPETPRGGAVEQALCGRVGVGLGGDTWDPACALPVGRNGFHDGPCDWSPDREPWELRLARLAQLAEQGKRDNEIRALGGTSDDVTDVRGLPEVEHGADDAY